MLGVLSFTCAALAGRTFQKYKPVAAAALLLKNCRRPVTLVVFIVVRSVFGKTDRKFLQR
jgi:hypothetical protein